MDAHSPTFTDAAGDSWNCRITWAAMRRAAAAGVDLSNIEEHLAELFRGHVLLVDTLWAILRPEAENRKIDRDTFEQRIGPEQIDSAACAIAGGMQDFYPERRAAFIAANTDQLRNAINQTMEETISEFANASTD